jgi:hypothetical protein
MNLQATSCTLGSLRGRSASGSLRSHPLTKGHTIASVNNNLKTLIQAIKLMLVNPDKEEIRWKYSALQIALGDLERFKDDF